MLWPDCNTFIIYWETHRLLIPNFSHSSKFLLLDLDQIDSCSEVDVAAF